MRMRTHEPLVRARRLTPLVACLNSFQRSWLASQLFMENAEKMIADDLWDDYMEGRVSLHWLPGRRDVCLGQGRLQVQKQMRLIQALRLSGCSS